MTIKNKQQADIYNLSAAQAGIWLGQQILPEACVYGAAEYLPLGPSIDIERFHTAFKQLQSSADIFRLSLVPNNLAATEGELPVLQRIEHSDIAQTLTYKQFGSLSLATQWMKNDIAKNSLYQPEHALYRCSLIQYLKDGENHWLFYMAIHHMICDGYGFNLLFKHLCALYNGSQNTIKATQISTLAPVIAEDNRYRQSSSFKKDAQFWQQQLQNLPQPKPLTSTAQSPSIPLDHVVASQALSVDLNQLSIGDSSTAQAHSHWVDTCLALSLIWRFQKTGERDICLGLPVMNRYGSVSARTPAMAMNIIPLRIKIDSDDTLISLQKKARSNINAAQCHQRYRYEDIRQSRSDKHPLFSTVVNIQPYFEPLSINQYVTETCAISSGPVDDLSLTFAAKNKQQLKISFEYNRKKYSGHEIESFKKDWQSFLSQYLSNPQRSIHPSISTLSWLKAKPLPQAKHPLTVIESRVHSRGNHPAIIDGESSISYHQLWRYAKQQASQIDALCQASTKRSVVLYLPRSSEAIIAMLGCWLSGACFTVLDPLSARERNERIINNLKPDAILYAANSSPENKDNKLWQRQSYLNEPEINRASSNLSIEALAYKIYTSGSTGTPKGVEISHLALNDFISAATDKELGYGLNQNDRVLQFAPLQFDACIEEIFVTLSLGASLVIRPENMIQSCQYFLQQCQSLGITVLDLPTAYWQELARYLEHSNTLLPHAIHTTIIGGEALDKHSLTIWLQHCDAHQRLLNSYGPSEACVVASFTEINTAAAPISIGRPLRGRILAIIDEQENLLPRNRQGELCIAGAGLANGYHQQSDLTEKFFGQMHSPESAELLRYYKTGDKALIDEQGHVIYLGRIDDEVKISGQRIQPAEIQLAIESLQAIDSALVLIDTRHQRPALIACVSLASPQQQPLRELTPSLRQQLRAILPEAMIPSLWFGVKDWPHTPSGKLDRRALLNDARTYFTSGAASENSDQAEGNKQPLTPLETQLSELWKKALGPFNISKDDDFFALGGQSLQTITLAESISRISGRTVNLPDIFARPTLSQMAELLQGSQTIASQSTESQYLAQKQKVQAFAQLRNIVRVENCSAQEDRNNILITGATGFVGRYLIKTLLSSSTATLTCIVRARDHQHARKRVLQSLEKSGWVNSQHHTERLHCLAGDLCKDNLGLSRDDYQSLSQQYAPAHIIHNAASVSVMQDFSSLADSNVRSTQQLLELSMRISAPLLLVSTIATADTSQGAIAERFYPYHKGLKDGYQQSKWAGESLAEQALAAGANVQVVRLGRVTSPVEGDEVNTQDLFWRILHASLKLGASPSVAITEPWTPVDFVAKALAGMAQQQISSHPRPSVVNLCPENPVALMRVFAEARKYFSSLAVPLNSISMAAWIERLKKHSDIELQTLAGFFDMHSPEQHNPNQRGPSQHREKNHPNNNESITLAVNNQHCLDILSTLKQDFVAIDNTLLQHYFDCAIKAGLVPNHTLANSVTDQSPLSSRARTSLA